MTTPSTTPVLPEELLNGSDNDLCTHDLYLSEWALPEGSPLSSYDIHRYLWTKFPRDGERPFLFRREGLNGNRALVLSGMMPDIASGGCLRWKGISPRYMRGGVYRFSLVANPVRKIGSRRFSLWDESDIESWVARKFQPAGELLSLCITGKSSETFTKKERGQFMNVRFTRVALEGTLECRNPAALKELVTDGVGCSKGFGCGMLLLAA